MISESEWVKIAAYVGAGLCMGFGAIGAGIGEGMIAADAADGCARQPKSQGETIQMMLLGQAMAESAAIFALVVSMLLIFNFERNPAAGTHWIYATCYLSAGIAMGLAAFGGSIGAAEPARSTCEAVARRPSAVRSVTAPMLLAAAVAQSTVIYALVIALILIFIAPGPGGIVRIASLMGAGLCMGLGAIGPALGEGYVGGIACREIAARPHLDKLLLRTMLLGQAVSETTGIYSLVVALILVFVA